MTDLAADIESHDERTNWAQPLVRGAGPRYVQIADRLGEAISNGQLSAGDRLPSQRQLASLLGVDLTTITRAYSEARTRGLIVSFGGRGAFVASASPGKGAHRVDLSMNVPPQPTDGNLAEQVQSGIAELLARQGVSALSAYDGVVAAEAAIQAGRAWLKPALDGLDTEGLVLCAGAQAAIFGVLLSCTKRGDTVLCEPLTYPGFLVAARQLGLRITMVESDEDGILPDALERCHSETGARVLYLNPTLNNPTTRVMSAERRQKIAASLRRLEMTLIEDDPYRNLIKDAPPPLATFTQGERTYYVASLSKCLWPSLRTAFILPPAKSDSSRMLESLRAATMVCSPLLAGLAEQWIRSGIARQLVQEIQREVRARQTLARAILAQPYFAQPTGLHIWIPLPSYWNQHHFTYTLAEQGILVASADAFSPTPVQEPAIRVSIGGASSQSELSTALGRIEALRREDPRRGPSGIV
ncbi:GntR family transcriptional regulator [Paraburkholderia hospita]|uniref:GntR family transcriptional regulator n=1 Tax=Paraburkholderia hospita TaxID=169430 RepID=A0ABN0FTQ5_9BURK|nr:PLP-dependent aminotransferase family protein [Paraburkholderia hospita]EIN02174.1 GntR family transcriptional regulator [Paraburkholderia hospita]OUL90135.1 GntR family transcriptional regulator [Paraburkholderia hospita]